MTDLIARLTAATEGSAELDGDVLRAAGWVKDPDRQFMWRSPLDRNPIEWAAEGYQPTPTRSIDAIVGLIEAEGWEWSSHLMAAIVSESIGDISTQSVCGVHPDRRLALCVAFLRAKAAATTEEPDNG